MARIRKDGTILLNEVQMATFEELKTKADEHGVIREDVIQGYKANVIRSIAKHGAIKLFRGKHYKIVATATVIEQPVTVPRTRVTEAVEQLMAA